MYTSRFIANHPYCSLLGRRALVTNASKRKLNTLMGKILSIVVTLAFVSSMCPGMAIAASANDEGKQQDNTITETEGTLDASGEETQGDDIITGEEPDDGTDADTRADADALVDTHMDANEQQEPAGTEPENGEGENETALPEDPESEPVYAEFTSNGMYCSNTFLGELVLDTDAAPALLTDEGEKLSKLVPASLSDGVYQFLTAVEQVDVQTSLPGAGNGMEKPNNNKKLAHLRFHEGEWQGCNGAEWFTVSPSSVTFYYCMQISRDEEEGSFTLDITAANWPYTKTKWMNPENGKHWGESEAAKYNAIPASEYNNISDPGVVVYQVYDEDGSVIDGFIPVYTYYYSCNGNKEHVKLNVKSESGVYGIDEIRIQAIGREKVVKNQAYAYEPAASFDDVVAVGAPIDANEFFTIPFGDVNEGRNPKINAMLVAVKVYRLVDAEYTVKHVVDGTEMAGDTNTVKDTVRKTDGAVMLDVVASSVAPKEYKGYKYDAISTTDPSVESGTVITLTYVPDYDQVKATSYTVKHVVNGVEMTDDEKSYEGSAWVNDEDPMVAIVEGSLEPNEYEGYEFAGMDVADDVESVADGSVITLAYAPVKEEPVVPPVVTDPDEGEDEPSAPKDDPIDDPVDDPADEPADDPVDDPVDEPADNEENIVPIVPLPGGSDGGIIIPGGDTPFTFPTFTFPPFTFPAVPLATLADSDAGAAPEETILSDEVPQAAPTVVIADDETPLVGFDEESQLECWVHWLMIAGMIVTVIYGVGVVARRRHLISELKEMEDDVLGRGRNDAYVAHAGAEPQMA